MYMDQEFSYECAESLLELAALLGDGTADIMSCVEVAEAEIEVPSEDWYALGLTIR